MWLFVVGAIVTVVLSIPITLALYTLLLAVLTTWPDSETCVYVGRVSHTRLVPVVHSFNYPLFMVAVDLEEVEQLWGSNSNSTSALLWPLSTTIQFRSTDHYKNGEGGEGSLIEKTFSLLKEKTNQEFSLETHRIVLLTHLSYYGYCFNPVSFYYILNRHHGNTDAIVVEVSNTPWNEMHTYVLHPESEDIESVKQSLEKTNYVFEKTFHVSPFMAMEYLYDWTFHQLNDNVVIIQASMKRNDTVEFTASVQLSRQPLSHVAWQVVKFPIYCAIIQVWIHIEAFWLFIKGVAYQPHPQGSETTASRMIANIMTPLFQLKDWFMHKKQD
jgi:DUF1365 family protein